MITMFSEGKIILSASGQKIKSKTSINLSSILTFLIKEASKCEAYSSDLFISWSVVEKELNTQDNSLREYWFGFRKMGVDHKTFIDYRTNSDYFSCYKLVLETDVYGSYGEAWVEAKLYEMIKEDK